MTTDPSSIGTGIIVIAFGVALAALWISAMISIFRRSSAMPGIELIGWCAFVIFAQFFGPLIWFFIGRDRYAAPSS